jgi:hypothetical protein
MSTQVYIKLDKESFLCLVRGGQLTISDKRTKTEINIILSDIGFNLMHELIERVELGKEEIYKELRREQ